MLTVSTLKDPSKSDTNFPILLTTAVDAVDVCIVADVNVPVIFAIMLSSLQVLEM